MASKANPWDADPVVSSGTNPWDADPVVASPAAPATTAPTKTIGTPDQNRQRFLDYIARAEGADYDVIVGGKRFSDFSRHPGVVGAVTKEGVSTAAGRYQITGTTYRDIAPKLGITDFSKESQDKIALELIRRKGALADVDSGNWEGAINKLGGIWASFPSSTYNQPKKSMEWSLSILNGATPAPASSTGTGTSPAYKPFAEVRKNVDPAALYQDRNWLAASALLYEMWERKPFKGEEKDLAEWGKDSMGNFNFNTVSMAQIAYAVSQGTQEQKEAFLYMLDTYDNTNFSMEGARRAAKGIFTDPLNLVGVGTLGAGTVANLAARKAAKEGAKALVMKSLARTGITAGMEGALYGGVQSSIVQGVEVSAGRREEISAGKVALDALVTGTAGVVLGTTADVAATKIAGLVKGAGKAGTDRVEPTLTPEARVESPAAPKDSVLNPLSNLNPDDILAAKARYESTTPGIQAGTQQSKPMQSNEVQEALAAGDTRSAQQALDRQLEALSGNTKTIIDKQGREIRLEFEAIDSGAGNYSIRAVNKDGNVIGYAGPGFDVRVGMSFADVDVSSEYRRAGIATALYDYAEELSGVKLSKSGVASADAEAFWKSRNAKQAGTPSPTNLTPDEILAAKARQQDGRLPADEVAPDMTGAPAKPLVDVPEANTGLRTTRVAGEEAAKVTKADVEKQAAPIVDQLRSLSDEDLPVALEQLRTGKFTLEEQRVISTATRLYADEIAVATKEAIVARDALLAKATRTPEEDLKIQALSQQIEILDARGSAQLTDDAFGSMAGTILNDRRLGSPSGVQTVDEIMAEKGLSREDAQKVWAELVTKAEKDVEVQKVVAGYDQQINQALNAGDLTEAAKLTAKKQREIAGMTEVVAPGSASVIAKATELAISNVFSFGTVIINLIPSGLKTLVIPGLKAIFNNPFEKATRVELSASYNAMRSSFGGALSAAKAAFKYEQALLTRDGTRLVEGELALTGKLGGALRIFPRILNASDEFLSRLNYDSFIAGRAAAEAAIEASEKGLKGDAFDKFVKEATDAAIKEGRQAEKGEELVQPIVNKGVNLGLTGDDLFKWVEKEILKNPDALLKGTDEEALNFVRDVLYKRKFSGEGASSKAAQAYEDAMQKFPSLKLVVGQLFFRTPIRVFEEGVRLTPGLQILAPNFLTDLGGGNGTLRQVRAQAEAMTSLAIAGAVLSLYSQGRITGDGAYSDWKQQRTRTDGPLPEPYTIKLEDGSTWSYRNFDPIATPVKIMINGLERMDRLRIREAQGEFIDKSLFDQAMAYVTVGTTAVAAAIRDANLVTGLNETIKLAENLSDPERKEGAWLKAVGDKLFLLVPNTLHKIAKDNDPTIKDPQTFWQMIDEKLARPFGQNEKMIKTAYSYDPLGNVRKIADEGRIWTVFSKATVEERAKGMSEEAQFVLAEMDRLARVTGATFKAPTKHPDLGDMDLRTVVSKDGKRTLYDVWQDNYRAMEPDKILYPIAAAPLPDGTYKYKEGKATVMQDQIKALQDAAFAQLMADEERVINKVIDTELNRAKAGAGLFDTKRPY